MSTTYSDRPDAPESKLATYWRIVADLKESDFDRMLLARLCYLDDPKAPIGDVIGDIGLEIIRGLPLYYAEFYLAVGCGLLLTELSYLDFYRTRWHERPSHRGYGEHCPLCEQETRQRIDAARTAPQRWARGVKKASKTRQAGKKSCPTK